MKKVSVFLVIFWLIVPNITSFAQEKDSLQNIETIKTWDRFSVSLGGFVAGVNTGVRLGYEQLGIGVDIKLEDALGMKTSNFVFRSDAMYRFGEKKKHNVTASYFSFIRSAHKVLESELEIGNHVFPIGTEVSSRFDLSIINISYDYSFFRDERIDLGASIGFFIMPIKFEVGIGDNTDEATDFIAPMPVIGLRTDFVITPKLYLKQNLEVLYLSINDFTGSIVDVNIRLEHNTWKNFGFGVGLNMYNLKIKANGTEYPNPNFVGSIEMGYTGLLFFGKYYF